MSKGRSSLRLKIGEVPRYPFVNVSFDVAIHLVDEAGQLKCGDEVPLNIKLCFEEKPPRDCDESILVLENPQPRISKTGTATIRAKITSLSMRYENKKFILQASAESTGLGGVYILPAASEPMFCIRYRLKILDETVPEIWYKDEGGRDKCIDLTVTLQDHNHELIISRKVPLRVTLLYESGHNVLKQDILKINPENKLMIDETGRALLRLRIEDVSKNHQKQLFTVQIVPDTVQHPLNSDISPDSCRPLEVRSKRNKRTRDPAVSSVMDRYPVTSQRTEVKVTASGNRLMSTPSSISTPYSALATPIAPSANPSPYALLPSSTLTVPPFNLSSASSNILPSNYSSASGAAITTSTACASVVNWMNYVMMKLGEIQWRQIGTESGTGRALYEMTNPNAVIEEIYQRYDNEAAPMAAKLYQDVCGNRYDEDENGDSYTGISQSSAVQPVVHLNSSRDRNDSDAQRAGTAALLGLSGTALPPPSRERDQSLFILPDDLPPFQRASTTEIFDTLSYSGFGPSDLPVSNGTQYIVAKKFFSQHVSIPLGLPAYNDSKKLIGCYIGHSDNKFIPLNEYPCRSMAANEIKKANEIGELWIESRDPSCVFSLQSFESEEKMVEEAIIWWLTHNETVESIHLWEP